MKIFGLEITKALRSVPAPAAGAMVPVHGSLFGHMWGVVREAFPGAWQRNIIHERRDNLLAFAAVYACVRIIAFDISKMRVKLVTQEEGVTREITEESPFLAILRKPNSWQTRIQFLMHWMTSKLLWGNTYALKERDDRNMVRALYVLDPQLTKPMVTAEGDIYYEIKRDPLSGITDELLYFPAKEIIHDRYMPVFHPLVGVTPLYACGAGATQGIRIQNNSAAFFENMSRPSGVLTAPGTINPETAKRLKETFESNFSGSNIGRLLVGGDGLKYEPMVIPPVDAQMIEQLKWTGEECARAFGVPLYKVGLGSPPTFNNISQINQDYYSQTLQNLIEDLELLLTEGLEMEKSKYSCEFDLDGLLRLDQLSRAEIASKRIGAGFVAPNEERRIDGLPPKPGGDSVFMQQQMYSLEALAKRPPPDSQPKPKEKPDADEAEEPEETEDAAQAQAARALADVLIAKFSTDLALN